MRRAREPGAAVQAPRAHRPHARRARPFVRAVWGGRGPRSAPRRHLPDALGRDGVARVPPQHGQEQEPHAAAARPSTARRRRPGPGRGRGRGRGPGPRRRAVALARSVPPAAPEASPALAGSALGSQARAGWGGGREGARHRSRGTGTPGSSGPLPGEPEETRAGLSGVQGKPWVRSYRDQVWLWVCSQGGQAVGLLPWGPAAEGIWGPLPQGPGLVTPPTSSPLGPGVVAVAPMGCMRRWVSFHRGQQQG